MQSNNSKWYNRIDDYLANQAMVIKAAAVTGLVFLLMTMQGCKALDEGRINRIGRDATYNQELFKKTGQYHYSERPSIDIPLP